MKLLITATKLVNSTPLPVSSQTIAKVEKEVVYIYIYIYIYLYVCIGYIFFSFVIVNYSILSELSYTFYCFLRLRKSQDI
jgi:hypothetical protein